MQKTINSPSKFKASKWEEQRKDSMKKKKRCVSETLTWLAFNKFKKLARLLTIPCQWATKISWAAAFASVRAVAPLSKLALDILGA